MVSSSAGSTSGASEVGTNAPTDGSDWLLAQRGEAAGLVPSWSLAEPYRDSPSRHPVTGGGMGRVTTVSTDRYDVDAARPRGGRLPRRERRAQLLGSALEVFVAQGYHAAAM